MLLPVWLETVQNVVLVFEDFFFCCHLTWPRNASQLFCLVSKETPICSTTKAELKLLARRSAFLRDFQI